MAFEPGLPVAMNEVNYESILSLEKSIWPFVEQLEAACGILGAKFVRTDGVNAYRTRTFDVDRRENDSNGPRYTWALKWILNKISGDVERGGPCLELHTWYLIHFLVIKIDTTQVAQTFMGRNFLSAVRRTLAWLRREMKGRPPPLYEVQYLLGNGGSGTNPKKRKRDDDASKHPDSVGISYERMCSLIDAIEDLVNELVRWKARSAPEHLKVALKCPPEEAANIVGDALILMDVKCRDAAVRDAESFLIQPVVTGLGYEGYINNYAHFWNSRYSRVPFMDDSSADLFMKIMLLPTLLLIDTFENSIRARPGLSSSEYLKRFVVTNAIEPLHRSSTLRVHDFLEDFDEIIKDQSRSSPVVKSLTSVQLQESSKKGLRRTNDESTLIPELVRSFFEIAITGTRQGSPQSHKKEDPFLQKLFDDLTTHLALRYGPESSRSRPTLYSQAVKALLNQAVESNLQLKVTTTQSILRQVSHLFDDSTTQQIEWEIVSLCLKNNPDTFLNSQNADPGPTSKRKPHETLKRLLSALETSVNSNVPPKSDRFYSLKLDGVLLPLIREFAENRDLPGYLHHWKTKLVETTNESLWVDDKVLSTVQGLLEPSLSPEQFRTVFEEVDSQLTERGTNDKRALDSSILVLLDCLVGAHCSETLQSSLSECIRRIHLNLATSLLSTSDKSDSQRWRVWRILAGIHLNWLSNESGSSIPSCCWELARRARRTIRARADKAVSHELFSFQERCFAFSFMVSVYAFEDASRNAPEQFRIEFDESINSILDLNNAVCKEIRDDFFHVSSPRAGRRDWSGKCASIESPEELYLSCIVRLLAQSSALAHVNEGTMERMLEQLSLLGRRQRDTVGPSQKTVSYSWLWRYAQRCDAIHEQKRLSKALRHRQCTIFTNCLDSGLLGRSGPEDGSSSALENLLEVPIDQLSADDIVTIGDGVLEVLRQSRGWRGSNGSLSRHLQLLAKVADVSKKACKRMKLFQNVPWGNDMEGRSVVISLAEVVSRHASAEERPTCDEALCRLTRLVLRYTYDTLQTETSTRYFTMFHQWIGAEMDRESVGLDSLGWTTNGSMLLVTMTALNYYHENRDQVSKVSGPNQVIDNIRKRHFERVFEICTKIRFVSVPSTPLTPPVDVEVYLKCLYGYMDLFLEDPRMLQLYTHLATGIDAVEDIERGFPWRKPSGAAREARALFYQVSYRIPSFRDSDAITSQLKPWAIKWGKKGSRSQKLYFQGYASSLSCEAIEKLLSAIPLDYQMHLILGLTDIQKACLQRCISQKFLALCGRIQATKIWEDMAHALRFLNVLLRKCPESISQYLIEEILSTLTNTATKLYDALKSPSGVEPLDHIDAVFTGLTQLLSTILSYHRPKLGGRYHLLVPVLQALLLLLFNPYSRSTPSHLALDSEAAALYARLLTTLCDPSPSAVASRKQRNHSNLDDETKRAKNVAGQHLHYLIMTYCECRISGNFASEGIKEALEPGLWAVLGCLGEDVRRVMNDAMAPDARAIWKRLYEDWRRVGEWRGGGHA